MKMLCKTPTKEDPRKVMTFEELEKLYGTDHQRWECAPHLRNEVETNVYSKGQPRSQWYVTDLVYRQVEQTESPDYIQEWWFDSDPPKQPVPESE